MPAIPSNPPIVYRKLTRMHRGLGLMSQLWLAEDHLLHVTSTGYTENYRRCYLRDIQSILIVHTARRTYNAAMLALLVIGAAAIMSMAGSGLTGYLILSVILGVFFLWNHLLGAGCRVVVVTAVQQEKISAFCRLPKTRRIIAELKPLIEAAQADFGAAQAALPPVMVSVETGSHLPPPLPPS